MNGIVSAIAMVLANSPSAVEPCTAPNHPSYDILIEQGPAPDITCPDGQNALQCIIDRYNNYIQDMTDLNEFWKERYCSCKCCAEEGGYENAQDCIDDVRDSLDDEFLVLWLEYIAWTPPAGCCVTTN